MSKKKMFKNLIYWNIISLKKIFIKNEKKINDKFLLKTINIKNSEIINNTGFFFKKLSFLVLAINNINFKKHKNLTLKSTIYSLWNSIATYNIIF